MHIECENFLRINTVIVCTFALIWRIDNIDVMQFHIIKNGNNNNKIKTIPRPIEKTSCWTTENKMENVVHAF